MLQTQKPYLSLIAMMLVHRCLGDTKQLVELMMQVSSKSVRTSRRKLPRHYGNIVYLHGMTTEFPPPYYSS